MGYRKKVCLKGGCGAGGDKVQDKRQQKKRGGKPVRGPPLSEKWEKMRGKRRSNQQTTYYEKKERCPKCSRGGDNQKKGEKN